MKTAEETEQVGQVQGVVLTYHVENKFGCQWTTDHYNAVNPCEIW